MSKKQLYTIVFLILVLAFLAGNLAYPQLLNLPFLPNIAFKLGLDLQGGAHLVYQTDLSEIPQNERDESMQGLRDVIERRVNLFGVREPIVQIQGERLVIELAGIIDPAEAIRMIGETPFLEFKEERDDAETERILQKQEEVEQVGWENIEEVEDWHLALENPYFKSTPLTGRYLSKAEVAFGDIAYEPLVSIQFDDEGAELFEKLTSENIGKTLAIYIDEILISAPVVQERISGGRAQITGNFTVDEARDLARNLSAGALPVPITLISQQTVGPTLGQLSLEQSLRAGIFGFIGIIIFMILFYKLPGFLAILALIIYVSLVLTIFKLVPVTLTLAGIAGFILSIGFAIDANILIFSRMREELREGNIFSQSLEKGFDRAWPAIRDGNLTTLIVAIILFSFGTSFVKGFALTLILGILISMFSAIIITKNFLKVFEGTKLEKIEWLWK